MEKRKCQGAKGEVGSPLPAELEQYRAVDERVISEITGLALQTLRNQRLTGAGPPFFKVPGTKSVRYRVSECISWMEKGRQETRR